MKRTLLIFAALFLACSSKGDSPAPDAPVAHAGNPLRAHVGEEITLDGSRSENATSYQWHFGRNEGEEGWEAPRATPIAKLSYEAPGRYQAVLTAFDALGRKNSASVSVSITHPGVFEPKASSTIVKISEDPLLIAAVVEDANSVAVISADIEFNDYRVQTHVPTCVGPKTIARYAGGLIVPCAISDSVQLIPLDAQGRPSPPLEIQLPYGARPYGAVARGEDLFVTLQGKGAVAQLELEAQTIRLLRVIDAIVDARAIALLPDGRLAVGRWRSPDTRGELMIIDPEGAQPVQLATLGLDEQRPSDTEIGGVPSYLNQLAVSPDGQRMAVASLQANVLGGTFRSGEPLTHETTIRGIVSFFNMDETITEELEARKQFDNRGMASAAVYSDHGDYLFVAMRGSRAVERFDVLNSAQSGTLLDVGFAPDGLVMAVQDRLLFVHAALSRRVMVYNVSNFREQPEPIGAVSTVEVEPLEATILRGKQLFNDSFDRRLTRDGYLACAHCHLDGESDNRVWDFTDRGEGLRNTISLLGREGEGHGPIHWSGNFDEVQDFENDIRGAFAGTGLMSDADFKSRVHPLMDSKAGLSDDLDALAAYVRSLNTFLKSPFKVGTGTGTPTEAAIRGRAIFEAEATGCVPCHPAPRFTDSRFEPKGSGMPLLHDVGTLSESSGDRLGAPLEGIDSPTLIGLFNSAPYLHDGSATTLAELLERNRGEHGAVLSSSQAADLEAYLLSIDGR